MRRISELEEPFLPVSSPHRSESTGDVISCVDCEFRHLAQLPAREELEGLYSENYYVNLKADYATQQARDGEWWSQTYRQRIGRYRRHLGEISILDIGSGPGGFLSEARRQGVEAFGLEPSRAAATIALEKGLRVSVGWPTDHTLANLPQANLVQLDQVIEHVLDPRELLENIRSFLPHRGAVSVIFANDFNPIQEIAWSKFYLPKYWVEPREHLNYFDLRSMLNLLSGCGFEVKYSTATFPIDIFLLFGLDYVSAPRKGATAHALRKRFESAVRSFGHEELLEKIYTGLAQNGLGRELEVLAVKA